MNKYTWLLILALVFAISFVACSSDDSKDETDGDTEESSETAETTPSDGDTNTTEDGDVVAEMEEEGGSSMTLCAPAKAGDLCFEIDKGDRKGLYNYHQFAALPSGCKIESGTYKVDMYEEMGSQSLINIAIGGYTDAKEYDQGITDNQVSIQWAYYPDKNDQTKVENYRSMVPCTVTVEDEKNGNLYCKMTHTEDASIHFYMLGAWTCSD